ncbi:MAG TPA: branched-chain amino acid transporter [Proteus sp.]|nr:branched-chain amino acid transporter [Proteus sp. (in: enterobacteria)]
MTWTLLLILALIIFLLRYFFLEPAVPVRLPAVIRQALGYSAPCLLTAICAPIVLLEKGQFKGVWDNPYLWGTLLCVVLALKIRNTLIIVLLTLAGFYLLNYLFN